MQKLIDMIDIFLNEKIANQISLSQENTSTTNQADPAIVEDLRLTVVQLVQTVQTLRDEYEENEQLDQYDVESLINDNTLDDDDIDRKIEQAIDSALESLTISVER